MIVVDVRRLGRLGERRDQLLRLLRGERLAVGEQARLAHDRRAQLKRRLVPVLVVGEVDPAHLAGHLVVRMPARAHGHVEDTRVDDVVGGVPADGVAQLDGGAGAVRLVAGGVGAIVEHPVLHIDEPGEGELGEELAPPLALLEEAEEHAIGLDDLALLDEREPVVEPVLEGPLEAQRFLIGPVRGGLRERRRLAARPCAAPVVARRVPDELVPRVERRGHVPDGLGHGQVLEFGRDEGRETEARADDRQAVIVVHEAEKAAIDPLMVGHVGVRGVDAHGLPGDLGDRPPGLDQFVEGQGRADLVPRQAPILELCVQRGRPVPRACHEGPPSI